MVFAKTEVGDGVTGLVAVIALLACSYYAWRTWWQASAKRRQAEGGGTKKGLALPPGRLGLPWIGESFSFLAALRAGDHDRFLRDRTARFGSHVFKTLIFNEKTVVLQGADGNRFVAASENKGLLRNFWPASMLAVVGAGVPIALHGPEHRRLRHVLLSCLCPAALHKLLPRAHSLTLHHFASAWPQDSHPLRLHIVPLLSLHNFRLACTLLANITDDSLLSRLQLSFNAWLAGMLDLPLDFPGTDYHRSRRAGDELRREMRIIIDQRYAVLRPPHARNAGDSADDQQDLGEDVLGTLLRTRDEDGRFLSHDEMRDVLIFLLFAGHDTTTAALTFTLKFLEQNPACLEMVVQEQEKIARQKGTADESLNWGDVQSMRYTWRVIQESMRLRPPVTASMKVAMQDLEFEGYHIPKGWKVYLSLGQTHSDEKYFSNASTFDPSRFDPDCTDAGRSGAPPFAYVPFGVGPHSCLGNEFARMTMCVYLHVLVRHFKWASINLHEKVTIRTFPTPVQGYPAIITPLKSIVAHSEREKTEN